VHAEDGAPERLGCETDPAEGVRRPCMKKSPFVLSCIGKRTREGSDRGSEVETVHTDKMGKDQFFRGNRRNLAGEGVVRKISSPQRVASVANLCNGRCQWAVNIGITKSLLRFWRANLPVYFREIQHDRRNTGSLVRRRRGSLKDPKYSRRTLVEKRWDRGEEGKGRLETG